MTLIARQIVQTLRALAVDRLRPLCVLFDQDQRIATWFGDETYYGFEGLRVGQPVLEVFPFLAGLRLDEPVELPFMGMNNGKTAHVSILKGPSYAQLVFADASREHARQQQIQQKANELDILNYRLEQLSTELKAARDELEIKRSQAEEASRAKGRFIAGMSHEFRTPLTSVLGYAKLIGARQHDTGGYLAAIERSARHLLSLIDNVLDQARLETGQVVINAVPTDLAALLADMESIFSPLALERNLNFEVNSETSLPPWVEVDEIRLRQILINIIGNALKFTKAGSVTVAARWQSSQLSITVTDTGPGIAQAHIEKIFEPFQRLDTTGESGAGLGLAICAQLIERMGGRLSVDSPVNVGSAFKLVLPAKEIAAPLADRQRSDTEAPAAPQAELNRGRVLLAEDDEDISHLVELFLGEAGYEILVASDGEQAVEMALRHKPDLVLMDLNLPRMDGFAATQQLRASDYQKPIVALTASPSEADRQAALEGGFNRYLLKPSDMNRLVALTDELTQGG